MRRFNPRSLRLRLTLWYCCVLILVACVLAGASRWALAVSLDHALDQSLRYRLIGLHGFIDQESNEGLERLALRLRALEHLGELFQVFGPHGELMAQSDGLARHHFSTGMPPDPGPGMLFSSAGGRGFPVRMATQRIYVNGQPLLMAVADPEVKFQNVLSEFYSVLFFALPIVLAVAALGGYWLSGRALAPVDQIIDEARAIAPANLSARLSVPTSGDELQRLSETLNQLLQRVEESVLQVRRFTADASHELRAPLTLIYTAAQFALRRERGADELKDALQKILREAKRCTELIDQLLSLARWDAASSRMELVHADLAALVSEIVGEAEILATERGLSMATRLPHKPLSITVDKPSFRRVMLILLDNAIKYTPPGGHISVSASEDESAVSISVADNGAGIPAADLPFIFDRFCRADKVRSRDAGGTGLGLAIAREIAQAHGADLSAQSSLGHGSTFTLRFVRSNQVPGRNREGAQHSLEVNHKCDHA